MQTSIHQRDILNRRGAGKVGMLDKLSYKRNHLETGVCANPQRPASKTLTVDTFAVGEYKLTIEGREISYVAVAGDTDTAGVAAKIAEAINADPQVRGFVSASANGSDVVLSSLLPGFDFSASESDANLSLADTQSALEAEAIPFGRLLFYGPDSEVLGIDDDGNTPVKLPDVADVQFKTYNVVLVGGPQNNTDYRININGGEFYSLVSSDADATEDEILGALATGLDLAESVTAIRSASYEAGSGVLVIEMDSQSDSISVTQDTNLRISSVTDQSNPKSLVAGFAVYTSATEGKYLQLDPIGEYAPNEPLQFLSHDGDIFVSSEEAITRGDKVYVGLAGDERGLCFTSPGADRLDVSDLMCFWRDADNNTAMIRMY